MCGDCDPGRAATKMRVQEDQKEVEKLIELANKLNQECSKRRMLWTSNELKAEKFYCFIDEYGEQLCENCYLTLRQYTRSIVAECKYDCISCFNLFKLRSDVALTKEKVQERVKAVKCDECKRKEECDKIKREIESEKRQEEDEKFIEKLNRDCALSRFKVKWSLEALKEKRVYCWKQGSLVGMCVNCYHIHFKERIIKRSGISCKPCQDKFWSMLPYPSCYISDETIKEYAEKCQCDGCKKKEECNKTAKKILETEKAKEDKQLYELVEKLNSGCLWSSSHKIEWRVEDLKSKRQHCSRDRDKGISYNCVSCLGILENFRYRFKSSCAICMSLYLGALKSCGTMYEPSDEKTLDLMKENRCEECKKKEEEVIEEVVEKDEKKEDEKLYEIVEKLNSGCSAYVSDRLGWTVTDLKNKRQNCAGKCKDGYKYNCGSCREILEKFGYRFRVEKEELVVQSNFKAKCPLIEFLTENESSLKISWSSKEKCSGFTIPSSIDLTILVELNETLYESLKKMDVFSYVYAGAKRSFMLVPPVKLCEKERILKPQHQVEYQNVVDNNNKIATEYGDILGRLQELGCEFEIHKSPPMSVVRESWFDIKMEFVSGEITYHLNREDELYTELYKIGVFHKFYPR